MRRRSNAGSARSDRGGGRRGQDRIGVRLGKVLNQHQVAKHGELAILSYLLGSARKLVSPM